MKMRTTSALRGPEVGILHAMASGAVDGSPELTAAIARAIEIERAEGLGYGVGVGVVGTDSGPFVQWCRDETGALTLLEVQPGEAAGAHEALMAAGLSLPDSGYGAELGIWEYVDQARPYAGVRSDAELTDAVVNLMAVLNVRGARFAAYPE